MEPVRVRRSDVPALTELQEVVVREQDEVDHQTATQTAWIPLELEFPLVRFETEHSTDGTSLGTLLTTGLEAQWGQPGSFSCAQDFIEGVGVLYLHHQVCVFHDGSFTQVNSWRWSGDVTFLSTEFVERRFPDGSTEGGTFIFNFTGEAGPVPPIALGATYTIRFEVQGSEPGARTYGSTIVVPIDQVHVPWWIQFGLTTEARWVQPEVLRLRRRR